MHTNSPREPALDNIAPAVTTPPKSHKLAVEFTGSGSEYFRIWIVNLLLVMLTLGLYFPWAKVRRLRYFAGNTLIDGEPMDFHGDPKKMFKGYVLVAILFGLYNYASNVSATAGLVALLVVAGLWPALFKSSMQFRLANTSWRGLRLRFMGDLAGAYKAMLPIFIPSIVSLFVLVLLGDDQIQTPPMWVGIALGGTMLSFIMVAPWLLWNLKNYQHQHYAIGTLQTQFRAKARAFYWITLKIIGVALLTTGVVTAIVFALFSNSDMLFAKVQSIALGVGLGMLVTSMVIKPYAITLMQNLVWTQTGNSSLRFISQLKARALVLLTLKNWLLMALTLGLYWPFALVATTRLRLEAITVKTRNHPDTLIAQEKSKEGDAAGDAAGDFFGLDVGL